MNKVGLFIDSNFKEVVVMDNSQEIKREKAGVVPIKFIYDSPNHSLKVVGDKREWLILYSDGVSPTSFLKILEKYI